MKKKTILLSTLLFSSILLSQQVEDSIKTKGIQEVIIIKPNTSYTKEAKPLGSIDDYLNQSTQIEMIRRGAYAWEPNLNNMSTERSLITIDGMRIFGACTDKMDPITSYVEVSNLASAKINNGQQGSCHGTTIGGSINLERTKNNFGPKNWKFNINSGFETTNNQKILGAAIQFKNNRIYNDANFMMRDAGNYKAGNHQEIAHSQYKKINLSETLGFKINNHHLIEGSFIYDKATDVGYPALPMDVSLAEAIIGSFKHQYSNNEGKLKLWETKIYYNTITHRMDDTQRPSVPIHMDMPGWSTTYGYYSKAQFEHKKHQLLVNLSGFLNNSLAEMTMYPNNPTEKLMYMQTWPDVNTINQGLFIEDNYNLNDKSSFKFTGALTYHSNKVKSEMGIESLQIFYPTMKSQKDRLLKSLSINYNQNFDKLEAGVGIAYGERAPSVSEGYGFYLFNSAEKYDYIGNPFLKNEQSWEGNAYLNWKNKNIAIKLNASYFNIRNYIVGEIIPGLIPMTIGASGVKKYTALESAYILNLGMNTEIRLNKNIKWNNQIALNKGKDNENEFLPFISPLRYRSAITFDNRKFSSEIAVAGNSAKKHFNPKYGESYTSDYALIHLNVGYHFRIDHTKINIKTGVENLLDTYYTTFSDWNKIPRPGRNFYVHLNFSF